MLERNESQLTEHAAVCWNKRVTLNKKKNTSMTAKHWIPSVRRTDELNTTLFQAWNHFPLTLSLCQSKITTLWWKQGFYLTVLCDSVAAPGTCVGGSKAFLTSDNFHFAKGDKKKRKKKEAGYRWRLDKSWRAAITFCRWNLQRARFFSRPDSFVWQFGRSLHISQFFFFFFLYLVPLGGFNTGLHPAQQWTAVLYQLHRPHISNWTVCWEFEKASRWSVCGDTAL